MKPYLALALVGITACHAASRDPVADRMKALFPQSDADRDGVLSPAEQEHATASVRDAYGEAWARRIRNMFAHAETPTDRSVARAAWLAQIEAYARPPVKETVLIPMRDGKRLATDIYRPTGDGPFPVLLSRTPYSRRKHAPPEGGYTRDGYAYVVQDMRGRFDSEGENLPFVGCGWGEHQDGVDTVAWLREQPWCGGNIGTVGGSAGGITQNLLAGAAPEGLKAQYVSVAAADLYADAVYTGGALRKADAEGWIVGNGFDPRAMETIRAHPAYDGYWQTLDSARKFARMNVPAVHVGGWFDMFAQATLNEFAGRQHAGGVGARGAQKLVMGPWTHAVGHMPVGDLRFPDADRVPERYGPERWFAHTLCGDDNGIDKEPAVIYYVMGDAKTPGAPGNEWRTAADWPVPATEKAAYLTRDGGLAFERPNTTVEVCREYVFCPTDPCPTIGGNNLNLARGPMNQNRIESRGDVVLFTSTPLAEPLEVTGRVPWVSLHEAVSRADRKARAKGKAEPEGAWANRGVVIRAWRARLGGRDAAPWVVERGVNARGSDSSTADFVPPPGVTRLEPGDFVEATFEHVIMPQAADDYYGPNAALREALRKDADTWRMIQREAVGNDRQVAVTRGALVRVSPSVCVRAANDGAAFTLAGGLGYVPVTFEGLASPDGYTLRVDGQAVGQSVHGRDFWQADYDPVSKRWSLTYTVPAGEGARAFELAR